MRFERDQPAVDDDDTAIGAASDDDAFIAGASTDEDEAFMAGASTDDDIAIGASDEEAITGASDEDEAAGASDDEAGAASDELDGAAEDDAGASDEDDGAGAASDELATLEEAVLTGVVAGLLKIQIRPMITITATMMIIQVLRFIGKTLGLGGSTGKVDLEVPDALPLPVDGQ